MTNRGKSYKQGKKARREKDRQTDREVYKQTDRKTAERNVE